MADIQGTNVAAPIRPYNTDCTYPTALADEIAGGLKYVEAESLLSRITAERRPVGTVVSVGIGRFKQWTGTTWQTILKGLENPTVAYSVSEVHLKFGELTVPFKPATANAAGILTSSMFSRLMAHAKRHLQDGDDAIASTSARADMVPQADKFGKIASGWLPYASVSHPGTVRVADDGQSPQDEPGAAVFVLRANDSRIAKIPNLVKQVEALSFPVRYVDTLPAPASANSQTFYCDKITGLLYLLIDGRWMSVGGGPRGEAGKSAYEVAQVQGYSGTIDQWLTELKGRDGDDGANGQSAYELARANGFAGTFDTWLESLRGPSGSDGRDGANGKSAYQLAQESGFVGALTDWLASLKGERGVQGKSAYELAQEGGYDGTLAEWIVSLQGTQGDRGDRGNDGKSAYEIAVGNGFYGSVTDWLGSLSGRKGDRGDVGRSAYELARDTGFAGNLPDWLASLRGEKGDRGTDGKSAYALATDGGFVGSLADWLGSLQGEQGEKGESGDGKSAYALAVQEGFTGTQTEWLASLRGTKGDRGTDGKSAYEIATEGGFTGTLAEWLESLRGEKGDPGMKGEAGRGVAILAYYDSLEQFETAHPTGRDGDCYGVAGNLLAWAGDHWTTVGKLIGASAYEIWLEQPGNSGKSFDDFFRQLANTAFSAAALDSLITSQVAAWMTANVASVVAPLVESWLHQHLGPLLDVRLPGVLETSFHTHVSDYHEWQPM